MSQIGGKVKTPIGNLPPILTSPLAKLIPSYRGDRVDESDCGDGRNYDTGRYWVKHERHN